MTTVGMLLRNESLKTFKRLAFLITAAVFAAMNAVGFGHSFLRARSDPEHTFGFPDAWRQILGDPVHIAMFFSATMLILLIGSEYSWKTARQNVIDGLSKNQWFSGKLMLLPMMMLVFLGLLVVIGGTYALLGTQSGQPLITAPQARMLGGCALAVLGLGSMATFFAFLARSSGPGLAMFFLWVALLEQIGGAILQQLRPAWAWLVNWFPARHFLALPDASNWDPAAYARAVQIMTERNLPLPEPPAEASALVLVSIAYVALFLGGAFLVYRSRDL